METINFQSVTVQQIIQLIQFALSGINQKIQQATKILKAFSKVPQSLPIFTYILTNANNIGFRQMAAVLMKRNLPSIYSALKPEQQHQFRNLLLTQYARQNSLLIQKGIATLVSILIPLVTVQKWTELQQLIDSAIQSAPQSAATFVLLNSILSHFKAPQNLFTYILNALKIQSLTQQAIKCVVSVVQSQDVNSSFAQMFITIWSSSNWPEEVSLIAMQVLNTMIQRKIKLSDQVSIWICDKIISNKHLSHRMRIAGCDFFFSYADFAAKTLASKQKLLKKVVQTVCLTCSQPYKHRQDEDDDQKGQFVQEIALWLIQTLAATIKPKKIYPVLFEAAVALINSSQVDKMNTGFLILGSMCEGCGQKIKKNLPNPIMNVLIPKGLAHSAHQVRGAAIHALCYFSEHLIPEIFDYHGTVIPAMMNHIGDLSSKVVQKALIAIDVFFDGMQQDDIILYLDVVIPKMIQVLGSGNSSALMKAAAISAIGSAVQVAQLKFQPYLAQVLPVCQYLLELPATPQTNMYRSENVSVLGKIAFVFCRDTYINHVAFYEQYIMKQMQKIYSFLIQQSDSQIRQASFSFFYLVANAIGSKFQIVFDNLIPIILKACQPKQIIVNKKKNQFSLDSDSQEQQTGVVAEKITEHDEKAAAIHALGELGKACPIKFGPYFEHAFKLLDQHYQHFYQNIRIQVCNAYSNLTIGLVKSQNGGVLPKNIKKGLPCLERYPKNLQQFFKTVLIPRLLMIMNEDDDNKVRGAAVQSIDDLVKQLGPAFVDKNIDPVKQGIIRLLQAIDDAQIDDEEGEQQQEQEQTDYQTFESICDLIPTLAQNLLMGFQPTLLELHPYMLHYLEQRQQTHDYVMMTGCLSQCVKFCPGYASYKTQQLFRSLINLVSLWETDVNRNIVYCLGQMFEKSSKCMLPYLQQGLLTIKQIYDHPSSSQACKQNSLASLCRIIYTFNPPFPQQIFIDALIKSMPFKSDEQQQRTALKGVMFLAQSNPEIVIPYKANLIMIIQNDLKDVKKYFIQEIQNELVVFLNQLKQ